MSNKTNHLVPFTSRLPAEMIALIDQRAELFNRSRAQEIHFLLREALKGLNQLPLLSSNPESTSPSSEQ